MPNMGHSKGSPVWWTAVLKLVEPCCYNRFIRKKYVRDPDTREVVLSLDLMIEGSNNWDEEDEFIDI